MARPVRITDIELETVEFATIDISKISISPNLLKGYAAFLEMATKAGATVDNSGYRGAVFSRQPDLAEQRQQLSMAQSRWDSYKNYYEQYQSVGHNEHSFQTDLAENWAKKEGLPWPPEVDPIESFDVVINHIDEAVDA